MKGLLNKAQPRNNLINSGLRKPTNVLAEPRLIDARYLRRHYDASALQASLAWVQKDIARLGGFAEIRAQGANDDSADTRVIKDILLYNNMRVRCPGS